MDFSRLFARLRAILFSPRTAWPEIAEESASVGSLYAGWILWLAAVTPLATLVGLGLFGLHLPFVGTIRIGLGMLAGRALIHYGLTLLAVFLMAIIAAALAANFGGRDDRVQALKVVAYAWTPVWVIGVLHLIPLLGLLTGLLTLLALGYGVWLLWLGAQTVQGVPGDRAAGYTAVLIIIGIVLGIAIGVLSAMLTGFGSLGSRAMHFSLGDSAVRIEQSGQTASTHDFAKRLEHATRQMQATGEALQGKPQSRDTPDIAALKPLSPDQLKALLPASLPGLARSGISAERSGITGLQVSEAKAGYGEGEQRIELSISDLAANRGMLAMMGMVQTEQQTDTGFHKVYQQDGRTVVEDWDNNDHHGQYTMVVAERFLVKAEGDGADPEVLRKAVDAVDLTALEKLKNTPGQ